MAEENQTGQRDLEKELTCSICKEVLFQPLTLLDCLHSFCGGCLKEWFQHQASVARSLHPYTCPSCRASVRLTRPNATVTTLLESFLRDNPRKARTDEDKQEQREKFSPGDNIMPKLRLRGAPRSEEDQHLMDEVMALSLMEAGITSNNTLQEPERRTRGSSRGNRSRDASRSPGQSRTESQRTATRTTRPRSSRGPSREPSPPATRVRQVAHQHSLRSILSVSELDPQELQEDIMRQIAEEGLLNDIDWNNLDGAQEEELSEMIARAYQQRREQRRLERRQRDQATNAGRPRDRSAHNSPQQPEVGETNTYRHVESAVLDDSALSRAPARPPVSNPHLIDSANQVQTRHRRTGSQTLTPSTSRVDSAIGANTATPATSGLGIEGLANPRSDGRRRLSNERRSTDPERTRTISHRPHAQSNPATGSGSAPTSPRQLELPPSPQSSRKQRSDSNPRPQRSPLVAASTFPQTRPSNNSSPSLITSQLQATAFITSTPAVVASPTRANLAPTSTEVRPSSSSSSHTRPMLFTEPSISCDRCGKSHIEYDLHYGCRKCNKGKYNICLPCYRSAKGCLHWYGFGLAAWQKYERQRPPEGYPPTHDPPHILEGRRYLPPQHPKVPAPTLDQPQRSVTEEDPAKRLQDGAFCDICSAFGNPCFWKCDVCNDGAWGYCNDCVNQGRHCTHPLLPLKAESLPKESAFQPLNHLTPPQQQQQLSPPSTPKSASIVTGPSTINIANRIFQPLTFTTNCDICTYPISPSNTRFHCPTCNDGDYDICSPCYHGQVSVGNISAANGPQGWRRCPQGHRMVIIGFEDRDGGQRRIVQRDRVGGWALKEEDPSKASSDVSVSGQAPNWSWKEADGTERKARPVHSSQTLQQNPAGASQSLMGQFPPDGGVGLRFFANWGYYPVQGRKDELMFPKGAEIREAEDINGDWFWGGYAGAMGLFPGNYGRVI